MSYQANHGNQPLPASYNVVDKSTFNWSLPQSNDVNPPVNQPPGLDGRLMASVAAMFRTRVQNSAERNPLNIFAYNLVSQNYFQNPRYTQWLQIAMDFTAFLLQAQRKPMEEAVGKAVTIVYTGMLSSIGNEFPSIVGMLDRDTYADLAAAGRDLNDVLRDIELFRAASQPQHQPSPHLGYGNPQPQGPSMNFGHPTGRQLPPTSIPQHQPHGPSGGMAPAPYQVGNAPGPGYGGGQPGGPISSSTPAAGRYGAEAPPAAPYPTTPAPQSWTAGPAMANIQAPTFRDTSPVPPQQPEVPPMSTDPNAPQRVEEIDLLAYVGADRSERPFDEIYIPGGAVARPAHLSGWKRTRSAEKPYAIGYDPQTYVLFHVMWPSGTVEELLLEYQSVSNMDYLQHEINTRLRGEKIKPEGKVIPSHHKLIDFDKPPQPVEEVKQALDDGLMEKDALQPVVLDGMFTATTDLENEENALDQVAEQLGLSRDDLTRIPPHEYTTANLYPLNVPEEAQTRLKMLATSESLVRLARGLVEAVNDGVLSRRYYRFLDDRLTRMVNGVLADNMGLEQVNIDSFVEDIESLFSYLQDNVGSEFAVTLKSQTKGLLSKWLSLQYEEDSDDDMLYLADEYVNLQLPWSSDDIASLNLGDEPVLLSQTTHPKITRVANELIHRHGKNETLVGRHFRFITVDGIYLEVIRGWLVESALLLKRLN